MAKREPASSTASTPPSPATRAAPTALTARQVLDTTPRFERRFHTNTRAFGRFGMRIFAPAAMDSPHWHGHIEANFLSGGSMIYIFDGQEVVVEDGCLVLFWAGVPHQLTEIRRLAGEPRLCNIYLPLDTFLFMPHIAPLQVAALQGAMIAAPGLVTMQRLEEWYADYRSREVERHELVKMELNALLRRVCLREFDYLRQPLGTESARHDRQNPTRHVIVMLRHVLENLDDDLTSSRVAAVTGLNVNYALGLFSRTLGISLKRFIIRMRLLRARALLLDTDTAIGSIVHSAGFNSVSQFYHHFVRAYGITPHQLRGGRGAPRLSA